MSQFTYNTTFKCYTIGNTIKTNNNYEYTILLIVKYFYTFLNLFCKNCMINLFLGTNKVITYSEMDQNNCMTICLKIMNTKLHILVITLNNVVFILHRELVM